MTMNIFDEMPGKRVEIPDHLDFWMQGDRFGEVERVIYHPSGPVARVILDKSGVDIFLPANTVRVI